MITNNLKVPVAIFISLGLGLAAMPVGAIELNACVTLAYKGVPRLATDPMDCGPNEIFVSWTVRGSDEPPPPPPPSIPSIVFLTSTTYTGYLGGLLGADAICQERAEAAGLPGTYKPWLSTDATSAADRLVHSDGQYVRTDGVPLAENWDDLTDGMLAAKPNFTEFGMEIAGDIVPVWTGTDTLGDQAVFGGDQDNCLNWSEDGSDFEGAVGSAGRFDPTWTLADTLNCNNTLHLYCIQQTD